MHKDKYEKNTYFICRSRFLYKWWNRYLQGTVLIRGIRVADKHSNGTICQKCLEVNVFQNSDVFCIYGQK